jgi:sarcosine oxidase
MSDHTADVIIIGGGVMGCAAAWQLAKEGRRTLLLEQFNLGHTFGSSHGPSRIIRLAYDSADYVRLAQASYVLWRELEAEANESLLFKVGGLDLGQPDALMLDGIRATYQALGIPFEALARDEVVRRYPQFNLPEDTVGLYQADYALLAADKCVATLAAQAGRLGATIHENESARSIRAVDDEIEVQTERGTYRAGRLILAAGSWMRPLLGSLDLNVPLVVKKEQLAFFQPHVPAQFLPGRFPLFIHRQPGTTILGSGFPIFGQPAGVKVMFDRIAPEIAAGNTDRTVDGPMLERLRRYAKEILPGLTGEIVHAVVCPYTMTPDEDFIIDHHPAHPQVVIASPCSGHGFKFAPVIGRILADLALRGVTEYPIRRFRLDREALKQ